MLSALKRIPSSTVVPLFSLSQRLFATSEAVYDVCVIGGGPGGYVASIKAAQLGLSTVCIESRGTLGGTCLNVGCIPSKALLHSSHMYESAKEEFSKHGILANDVSFDLDAIMSAKEQSVTGLTQGIEHLFKKNKVDYIQGHGKLSGATSVTASPNDGSEPVLVNAKNIIIATGSEPVPLPMCPVDNEAGKIIDSTGALSLKKVPKSLVVVGGGVIGLELGSVWKRLGATVTVVEFMPSILPTFDAEIVKNFNRILKKQKFVVKTSTKVTASTINADGEVELTLESVKKGTEEVIKADAVLVCTGRRPFTENLGLEDVGVALDDKGMVEVNDLLQTSVPSIYAIGDVIRGPMLAHKAEDEGLFVAELLAGMKPHINYECIPGVVYTSPEIACVGKTEEELKEAGVAYNKGVFPFMANSRARTNMESEGLVKILADKETDEVLGVHIVGSVAGEMIAEGVLAMEMGCSSEDIARTCHAHPTLSEAVKEAAMATFDKPIHM